MTKQDYELVLRQLPHRRRLGPTVGVLFLDFILILGSLFFSCEGWLASFLCGAVWGVVFLHGFAILHECSHYNLSSKKWVNVFLGHLAGAFAWMPFYTYRYGHRDHHQFAGNEKRDPVTSRIYAAVRKEGIILLLLNFVWRVWIPLIAFVQILYTWFYFLIFFFSKKEEEHKRWGSCALSTFILFSGWGLFLWANPDKIGVIGIGFLFYLILSELISFPHHYNTEIIAKEEALKVWEQTRVTRSCYFPKGVSELMCLNFNFHVEHHLFPTLPWYELRKARELILKVAGKDYLETHGFQWDYENRRKNIRQAILSKHEK